MKRLFPLFIVALLLIPSSAWATNYYVTTSGSGSACTLGSPCGTIAQGLTTAAGAGNTLYIASGTYTENPDITVGGSSGSIFTVQGFAPGGSCPENTNSDPLTPQGTNPAPTAKVVGQIQINASYVAVTCFDVAPNYALSRNYNYSSYNSTDSGIGISTSSLTGITISECYIHKNTGGTGGGFSAIDPSGSGYYVFNYAIAAGVAGGTVYGLTNITVMHNFVRMGGGSGWLAIACNGTCLVENNEAYGGEQDDNVFEGHDLDYTEVENRSGAGGGVTSLIHNYLHGLDQNFCGTTRHNCHSDCFEDSDWNAQNLVFDGNVCFNWNEGLYLWDCQTGACSQWDGTGTNYWAHGTYDLIFNVLATNNIFAFGTNEEADVCMDVWHAQIRFDNNTCWGTASEASLNSDILSYQNNINVATYLGPFSGQCTTPWGINLEGGVTSDTTTFDTYGDNVDYNDTTCTIPSSGLYVNDLRNSSPVWTLFPAYSNSPVATSSSFDFHLQSGSPARGIGANLTAYFTDDLDNNTRPGTGAWDSGTYQYESGATPGAPYGLQSIVRAWAGGNSWGGGNSWAGGQSWTDISLLTWVPVPSVALSWFAGSNDVTFNLYRGSMNGGPYSLIQSLIGTSGTADATVADGQTYYFVVTGVNSGMESGNSNQATAVVP